MAAHRAKKRRDRSDDERAHIRARRHLKAHRRELGAERDAHLPDVLVIGTQKDGTTSLFQYLCDHPSTGHSLRKELHFFSYQYERGLAWYRSHFPTRGEASVVGEASASYLADPAAPHRIRHHLPEAKLIALLRNPIDRAYSNYWMLAEKQVESLTFEQAIEQEPARLAGAPDPASWDWRAAAYLARGHYADQLRTWYEVFPCQQLLILQSERFFAQPAVELARVLDFLALPAWTPAAFAVHNQGRYPPMRPETRARLAAYFAPRNQALFGLLGRTFDWDLSLSYDLSRLWLPHLRQRRPPADRPAGINIPIGRAPR